MQPKTIVIAGGSGMVGRHLADYLTRLGNQVIILTRSAVNSGGPQGSIRYAHWNPAKGTIDEEAIRQADAIVNLAGSGVVAKPWTEAYKQEIISSRVQAGQVIVKALQQTENNVQVVVNASAIGWYGPDKGGAPFSEDAPADASFLGETCRQWEQSIAEVSALQKRLVILRIGIVLAPDGGALTEFKKPLRFRVAGVLGSGRQMVSWIHIDDLCGIFQFALEDAQVNGIFNAVAPQPVSNRTLTLALAKAMHGKAFVEMPVPAFVLKMMMGQRSVEVLKSTTVSAVKLVDAGYAFKFSEIDKAIQNMECH